MRSLGLTPNQNDRFPSKERMLECKHEGREYELKTQGEDGLPQAKEKSFGRNQLYRLDLGLLGFRTARK